MPHATVLSEHMKKTVIIALQEQRNEFEDDDSD